MRARTPARRERGREGSLPFCVLFPIATATSSSAPRVSSLTSYSEQYARVAATGSAALVISRAGFVFTENATRASAWLAESQREPGPHPATFGGSNGIWPMSVVTWSASLGLCRPAAARAAETHSTGNRGRFRRMSRKAGSRTIASTSARMLRLADTNVAASWLSTVVRRIDAGQVAVELRRDELGAVRVVDRCVHHVARVGHTVAEVGDGAAVRLARVEDRGLARDPPTGERLRALDDVGLRHERARDGEQLHELARVVLVRFVAGRVGAVEVDEHRGIDRDLVRELAKVAQRVQAQTGCAAAPCTRPS